MSSISMIFKTEKKKKKRRNRLTVPNNGVHACEITRDLEEKKKDKNALLNISMRNLKYSI